MRRGIGLRGYAQQDPLNEFRREAFDLYQELRALIRHQVATTIFRVTVTHQPTPQPAAVGAGAGAASATASSFAGGSSTSAGGPRPAASGTGSRSARAVGSSGLGSAITGGLASDPMAQALRASGGNGGPGGAKPGFTPSGARIGRNDPCWCGSGQKYKKCHGR
jgi:preprotein translocase subunit SecA